MSLEDTGHRSHLPMSNTQLPRLITDDAKDPDSKFPPIEQLRQAMGAPDVESELGAKAFLAQGFDFDREYAQQVLRELPYGKWRDYNPEETSRFYALRRRVHDGQGFAADDHRRWQRLAYRRPVAQANEVLGSAARSRGVV